MAKTITKQARVLLASAAHGAAPNDLLEAPADVIDALAKAGIVDAAADAVSWCKTNGARSVSLVDAAGASELAAASEAAAAPAPVGASEPTAEQTVSGTSEDA